jgi:EAL domain-containing protein (putative c-di-GMP-specific phosphodiesterase class I)
MQGFLFSKPLTDREIKQLCQSRSAKTVYKGAVSAA